MLPKLALAAAFWAAAFAPASYCQWIVGINEGASFAVCIYPPPEGGTYVAWSVSVNPYSGWHDHHNSARDRGTLSPANGGWTDGNGCVQGSFQAPYVAGVHYILSCIPEGACAASDEIYVQVYSPYLTWLPERPYYQLVGYNSNHQQNHWGTPNAVDRIQLICAEYYSQTGLRAGVNDMSLPWGGIFDLGPSYGGEYWNHPHDAHMFGKNADMPFQYLGTPTQRELFRSIATDLGGNPWTEDDLYHLRFSN